MSHYYGTVKGNRGSANRCGTRESGITAAARSYNGSVIVDLSYHEGDKCDMVSLYLSEESSTHGKLLFYGTFKELEEKLIS